MGKSKENRRSKEGRAKVHTLPRRGSYLGYLDTRSIRPDPIDNQTEGKTDRADAPNFSASAFERRGRYESVAGTNFTQGSEQRCSFEKWSPQDMTGSRIFHHRLNCLRYAAMILASFETGRREGVERAAISQVVIQVGELKRNTIGECIFIKRHVFANE